MSGKCSICGDASHNEEYCPQASEQMIQVLRAGLEWREKKLAEKDQEISSLRAQLEEAMEEIKALERQNEDKRKMLLDLIQRRNTREWERDEARKELHAATRECETCKGSGLEAQAQKDRAEEYKRKGEELCRAYGNLLLAAQWAVMQWQKGDNVAGPMRELEQVAFRGDEMQVEALALEEEIKDHD
jgi:chromosome segregation ATPase